MLCAIKFLAPNDCVILWSTNSGPSNICAKWNMIDHNQRSLQYVFLFLLLDLKFYLDVEDLFFILVIEISDVRNLHTLINLSIANRGMQSQG